ncbi:FAD-linked oxidoreductase [Sphingopyxis bauzanensis]|uniref:FAD-linked oxidoreductase n=1 Tax=Sphingopyxis bauzanensis TaxID=651663 RepID=A0A246K1G7_9SPHN|nr:D-arabinono-1,4-lactone oxidase [Sphingopyxis bauzanensis]OWQ99363.1 FAD-linked oxidoreductase [Sphingopyxis bauzanensis]GGJ55542.1 FAD-binding oxidoreductase [Sphingopyxis bauzanensis]
MSWSNWSGSVTAAGQIARPHSEDELAMLIRGATKLRVTGAGHSFMPLCESDELIVNLDDLAGEMHVAADRQTARIPAGWSIRRLTAALWDEGLALANQGDVNPQSLAGAMATGTHGTGVDLGSLATFARGFRLIGADGEVHWCDATTNAELYQAQRLSLGLFGVATEIDVAVVPAFHLAERIKKRRWAEIRERYDELTQQHRHVEFWFFPHSDDVILKTLDLCDPCDPPPTTTDMEEASFRRILNISALLPFLTPSLQRLMMKSGISGRRRGPAHSIFPSDRTVRFEEMEYEMPRAVGLDTLAEVVGWIRRKRLPVTFPFEFRTVAADDIWMSPMNAGPVAAISMHQYAKMPWRNLFAEAETIFRTHGGRPHWAKRHTLTRADVAALYPMAGRYNAVRRAADPGGKFLNPHLESLFA